MRSSDGKKQPETDQGNAIENETREFRSPEGDETDDDRRSVKPSENELAVSEEESKLAEEHVDGGEPCGRKA